VWRDAKEYVTKNSWCLLSQRSEVIILGKLADVKEVSHLIDAKDVKLQSGKI
jgi:hypothetical protein